MKEARLGTLVALILSASLDASGPALAQERTAAAQLTLQDLEQMALDRSPTISQARAGVRAATGRQTQAGLYPNPTLGYELGALQSRPLDSGSSSQSSSGSTTSTARTASAQPAARDGRLTATTPPPTIPPVTPGTTTTGVTAGRSSTTTLARNSLWLQIPIVTAGKLGKSHDMATVERRIAEVTEDTQRLRVLTMVRVLYYEALGAARLVELREELARLTREAAGVSEELFNLGQADRPDVLEVEIEAERSELDVVRTRSQQERGWRTLAAAVGEPALPLTPLAGDLEANLPIRDADAVLARALRESPELHAARVRVERARAALARLRADRVPDFYVRARFGYLSEWFDLGRDAGFEAGLEIGIPLPLFDRQQGNLAAAAADVEQAEREAERLELAIRGDLASALKDYTDARAAVERYRERILPRARQASEIYEKSFRQMAAAYPQVLIAQRTLYRTRAEHVDALVALWRSAVVLDSLLLRGGLDYAGGATPAWVLPTYAPTPAAPGR
jgi:cobalt-zinc-cadmium efflux system outer membrane protein